jgi:hypothetical protein
MLINISVALLIVQWVDRFNDRAPRPIPRQIAIWAVAPVPQAEQDVQTQHLVVDFQIDPLGLAAPKADSPFTGGSSY